MIEIVFPFRLHGWRRRRNSAVRERGNSTLRFAGWWVHVKTGSKRGLTLDGRRGNRSLWLRPLPNHRRNCSADY